MHSKGCVVPPCSQKWDIGATLSTTVLYVQPHLLACFYFVESS